VAILGVNRAIPIDNNGPNNKKEEEEEDVAIKGKQTFPWCYALVTTL